jgi:DNA-binding MarR family transcriptional regulator
MVATDRPQLIRDLLGSAQVFADAVDRLMQERLEAVVGFRGWLARATEQLSFSQLKLLKLVARTEAYNISQVAAFMGVSNAAASKAVDRLVRRKLLRRSESEGDRRAVELAVTDEGRRILEQYDAVTTRTLGEIFRDFPADELQQAADLLDQLSVSLVERGNVDDEEACFRCGVYFREECLLREKRQCSCHFRVRVSKKPALLSGRENGFGSLGWREDGLVEAASRVDPG